MSNIYGQVGSRGDKLFLRMRLTITVDFSFIATVDSYFSSSNARSKVCWRDHVIRPQFGKLLDVGR